LGSVLGVVLPAAYQWKMKIKVGMGKSLLQGVGGSVLGGLVGTTFGAWRMKKEFE